MVSGLCQSLGQRQSGSRTWSACFRRTRSSSTVGRSHSKLLPGTKVHEFGMSDTLSLPRHSVDPRSRSPSRVCHFLKTTRSGLGRLRKNGLTRYSLPSLERTWRCHGPSPGAAALPAPAAVGAVVACWCFRWARAWPSLSPPDIPCRMSYHEVP